MPNLILLVDRHGSPSGILTPGSLVSHWALCCSARYANNREVAPVLRPCDPPRHQRRGWLVVCLGEARRRWIVLTARSHVAICTQPGWSVQMSRNTPLLSASQEACFRK